MPDLPTLVPGYIHMGTTLAGHLVRHAPCPVLLVRPAAADERWDEVAVPDSIGAPG